MADLRSWRRIRRVVFGNVQALTVETVLRYARGNIGRKFRTLKRGKQFRLEVRDGAVVFRPSSGRTFWPEWKHYVAEFNRTASFRPGDYSDDLWSRSYFVSLLAAMFRENKVRTPRAVRQSALEKPALPSPALERKVKRLRRRGTTKTPLGQVKPERLGTTTVQFKRDPAVKAWVLEFAGGICELCREPAPFKDEDGHPFLELHHVEALSSGGPDTVSNAVAVCPNCHRACHLSNRRRRLAAKLYRNCARLLPPGTKRRGKSPTNE